MLEHLIPPMNVLKCKEGVFLESLGFFFEVSNWFSGAFLMLPRDGTMEIQGYANGWKVFTNGTQHPDVDGLPFSGFQVKSVSLLLIQ